MDVRDHDATGRAVSMGPNTFAACEEAATAMCRIRDLRREIQALQQQRELGLFDEAARWRYRRLVAALIMWQRALDHLRIPCRLREGIGDDASAA